MRSLKLCLYLAIAGLSSVAQASFELLLAADNGANVTFNDRKIHRFDSVSGAYLGSFGGFAGEIYSTHINQSTNSLFVETFAETTEWDYNTGLLKASYAAPGTTYRSVLNPAQNRRVLFDLFGDMPVGAFPSGTYTGFIGAGGTHYASGIFVDATTLIAYDSGVNRFRTILPMLV